YLTTANITAAAAVAITVGLAQIAAQRFTRRRIWSMQWISLAVVIVLSAASIATQSPRFVMLKPSLGHFAIATAMLKRRSRRRDRRRFAGLLPKPALLGELPYRHNIGKLKRFLPGTESERQLADSGNPGARPVEPLRPEEEPPL